MTSTVAKSFTLLLIILAASRMIFPLSIPDIFDHELKASFAESTARLTSGLPEPCVWQIILPVDGSMT